MIVIKNKTTRNILKIIIPFLLVPLLVGLGSLVFDEKKYLVVSFGVAILSVVLFIADFEKKVTGSRRMVIIAVMTALCIVGRLIPFFKPVTALIMITAMYLGGETGFLTGALSALLSNFYFGQGPWTPFQMMAWGLIGLVAGYLSNPLKKSKVFLLVFGAISGMIFSLLMDVWTVIWYNGSFSFSLFMSAMVTAIPYTILYSVSNFVFLLFLAKPFGEKLQRVKIKYGI